MAVWLGQQGASSVGATLLLYLDLGRVHWDAPRPVGWSPWHLAANSARGSGTEAEISLVTPLGRAGKGEPHSGYDSASLPFANPIHDIR